ncbi:MAG: DUF4232 domain-containing protein [Streptomyces sp.]|uniref:DUF4232 domain-containing protein n=1 Tax=Streptomyces sp. TaxID=1931 RepID=UPI003D6B3F8B
MATHHARSVLAALAIGAALTATGCTAGSEAPSGTAAPAEREANSDAASYPDAAETPAKTEGVVPQAPEAQSTEGNPDTGKARSPWCTTEALSASLRSGQPAAGSRYAGLVLRNSSDTTCRTQGYPGIQLTRKNGEPIRTKAVRDHSRAPQPLTLAPGDRVSARLRWTVVPSEGDPADGRCPNPAALRVIPPDQRAADTTTWRLGPVCGTGKVRVLPLQAGTGGTR